MSLLSAAIAFREKALQDASNNTNQVFSSFMKQAVNYSPTFGLGRYSTGHLINQWYTASGDSPSSEVGSAIDASGSASIQRIDKLVDEHLFYGRDNTVTLTNNTQQAIYADKLGWEAGLGTNGWTWTGRVKAYNMTTNALNYTLGKYS